MVRAPLSNSTIETQTASEGDGIKGLLPPPAAEVMIQVDKSAAEAEVTGRQPDVEAIRQEIEPVAEASGRSMRRSCNGQGSSQSPGRVWPYPYGNPIKCDYSVAFLVAWKRGGRARGACVGIRRTVDKHKSMCRNPGCTDIDL